MTTTINPIPKGYILKARKIEDSEIAHAPPHVREVWDLILRKANFKDRTCGGTIIRRGQWLTTYEEIQELLHWRIGFRKETYSRWQIEWAMKKLRVWVMIATRKATRGLFINVLNYDLYQRMENYDCHTDCHDHCHNDAPRQRKNERKKGKRGDSPEGTASGPDALREIFPQLGPDCVISDRVQKLLTNNHPPRYDPKCIRCHQTAEPARVSVNDDDCVYYVCKKCCTHN